MKIKVLGSRGEIDESTPYHSKKSGVLIDDKILLDCGDKRFLHYKPKWVLITHLHPDHAYFVRHYLIPQFTFYAPEPYDGARAVITDSPFLLNGYRITPIPTIHSIKVKSNAYLIEHRGKRILYTGDMIWIEKKYHKLFKKLDLVITEGSFMRRGGMVRRNKRTGALYGHAGIPNLIHLFAKFTDTFLLVHFGSWFYKNMKKSHEKIEALAHAQNIKIIVGYDGLKITI